MTAHGAAQGGRASVGVAFGHRQWRGIEGSSLCGARSAYRACGHVQPPHMALKDVSGTACGVQHACSRQDQQAEVRWMRHTPVLCRCGEARAGLSRISGLIPQLMQTHATPRLAGLLPVDAAGEEGAVGCSARQ